MMCGVLHFRTHLFQAQKGFCDEQACPGSRAFIASCLHSMMIRRLTLQLVVPAMCFVTSSSECQGRNRSAPAGCGATAAVGGILGFPRIL